MAAHIMRGLRAAGRAAGSVRTAASQASATVSAPSPAWKAAAGLCGLSFAGSSAALIYGEMIPQAEEELVHAPHYPWSHSGITDTFDHASIRRGYEVYKQVCAACHSMDRIAFRNLVGVIYTEDEAKAIAQEYDVFNKEPNDEGEMFKRSAKLSDYFPAPYANEQESRTANGGAYPPDLSVIVKARHGNEDYIFSLLTGYCEPPAGVQIADGQHYNPYFPGGAISMQAPLYDEIIEYEDGTPATTSQLAKDVATFLSWTAEPEHDDRKKFGIKAVLVFSILTGFLMYLKRAKWASLKNRKIVYRKV